MLETYDWPALIADLNSLLKLKTSPVGMKFMEHKEELHSIPKLRKPPEGEIFYACQLIGQAARLNLSIGYTADCFNSIQCIGVSGLCAREDMEASR